MKNLNYLLEIIKYVSIKLSKVNGPDLLPIEKFEFDLKIRVKMIKVEKQARLYWSDKSLRY